MASDIHDALAVVMNSGRGRRLKNQSLFRESFCHRKRERQECFVSERAKCMRGESRAGISCWVHTLYTEFRQTIVDKVCFQHHSIHPWNEGTELMRL